MEQAIAKPALVDFREAFEIQTSSPKTLYELSRVVVEMSAELGEKIHVLNRNIVNAPIELTADEVHKAYGVERDLLNTMHEDLTNWYTGWDLQYTFATNAHCV
jgi:hypothetical protein